MSNGTSSVSGIVWHNSSSDGDYSTSEGHRRWSQALLYDNITFTNPNTYRLLGLYNRGNFGTGHGWSATHSVAWNVNMPGSNAAVIQRPPQRQNYAIACEGVVSGLGPFSHPQGYVEDSGSEPLIASLYEQQLEDRLQNGPSTDAPARFRAEISGDEVSLSWLDIADNESGYLIEVSYDGMTFETFAELPADETAYSFPTAQLSGNLVYLRMYANSAVNCPSAYTYTAFLDFTVSTETLAVSRLSIFPNPANDVLEVRSSSTSISSIQVFNLARQVIPVSLAQHQIQLAGLPPGIYFLQIETNSGEVFTKRFVKS